MAIRSHPSNGFRHLAIYMMSVAFLFAPVLGNGVSKQRASKPVGFLGERKFQERFMESMNTVLAGIQSDLTQTEAAKKVLAPMWNTMPKINGRVDRRSLRHFAYRYYMQTSSLLVRGFEPTRQVNNSHWGAADVLSQMVPAYVESVLESQHKSQEGFTMKDTIDLIMTLDRMIFESQGTLLDLVFKNQQLDHDASLSMAGIEKVVEEYMLRWMVDLDEADYELLLSNHTIAEEVLPNYRPLLEFIEGRVKTLKFNRERLPPKRRTRDVMLNMYNYEDAHHLVGVIAKSFSSFWQQSECGSIKMHLISMDKHNTGRVPLARFYDQGISAEWRFGESTDYLRDLGALDETSTFMGPQVIIPNYLKAASNCFVQTAHYLICCPNDCEALLSDIELRIMEPSATPSTILNVVENMTLQLTLEEEVLPNLDNNLVGQLEQIAMKNNGLVPLHGRLFAQWMHYVFPRECPFPHKMGTVSTITPAEYGTQYTAAESEMKELASNASMLNVTVGKEAFQWMSQWSEDEELILNYNDNGPEYQWLYLIAVAGLMIIARGKFSGGDDKKASDVTTVIKTSTTGDKIHLV
jgi:hypothetical protein